MEIKDETGSDVIEYLLSQVTHEPTIQFTEEQLKVIYDLVNYSEIVSDIVDVTELGYTSTDEFEGISRDIFNLLNEIKEDKC
jgi:aspartate oxidase